MHTWTVVSEHSRAHGGGGVWGYGGVSVDPVTGHVYARDRRRLRRAVRALRRPHRRALAESLDLLGSWRASRPGDVPVRRPSRPEPRLRLDSRRLPAGSAAGTMVAAGNKNGDLYVPTTPPTLQPTSRTLQHASSSTRRRLAQQRRRRGVPAYSAAGRMLFVSIPAPRSRVYTPASYALDRRGLRPARRVEPSARRLARRRPRRWPTASSTSARSTDGECSRSTRSPGSWIAVRSTSSSDLRGTNRTDQKLFAASWDGFARQTTRHAHIVADQRRQRRRWRWSRRWWRRQAPRYWGTR